MTTVYFPPIAGALSIRVFICKPIIGAISGVRSVEEVGVAIPKSRVKRFASPNNLLIIVIADVITGLELHPNHFISSSACHSYSGRHGC